MTFTGYKEASEYTGVPHRTLRRHVADGTLEVVRSSHKVVVFTKAALDAYVARFTRKSFLTEVGA